MEKKFFWKLRKFFQVFWVGHQNGTKSRNILVSYNFLIRTQKRISGQNSHFFENFVFYFLEKVENFFNFFSPKESLDRDLYFGFCFIKIGRLESFFLSGRTTAGGSLWPGDKKISENLPWTMPWYCNMVGLEVSTPINIWK